MIRALIQGFNYDKAFVHNANGLFRSGGTIQIHKFGKEKIYRKISSINGDEMELRPLDWFELLILKIRIARSRR